MSQTQAFLIDNLVDKSRLSCWVFICAGTDSDGEEAHVVVGPFTSASQAFEWADAMKVCGYPLAVTDPFSDKSRLKDALISQYLGNI